MKHSQTRTRRSFIKATAAVGAAPFVSRLSWAQGTPNQTLQYAAVGSAGRGGYDIGSITGHEKIRMVAAADVDATIFPKLNGKYEDFKAFSDWREMFEKMGDQIDIVSVSTPDHMHGIVALSAMNLKKHVYVQKPLAQTIGECRAMQECAHRNEVVVQMGTQGASGYYDRMAVELVQRGVIGKVSETWSFCGKGWGDTKPVPDHKDPVPEGLDWDAWLGVADTRPYINKYYHPKTWRRRQDLGTGTLGDMGCHIFNPLYRGLALTAPTKVRAETAVPNADNWAKTEHVEYVFPETAYTDGALTVHWVSGKRRAPKELTKLIPEGTSCRFGCLLKGSEGVLLMRHGQAPLLLPQETFKGVRPAKFQDLRHHHSFIDAAISGDQSKLMSPIDYAAPMTEFILLGNIAMQHSPGWLEWDAAKAQITNNDDANTHVQRTYREGWKVMGA
jgi:predicted dehydrogenase